jgi:hypothetical protein
MLRSDVLADGFVQIHQSIFRQSRWSQQSWSFIRVADLMPKNSNLCLLGVDTFLKKNASWVLLENRKWWYFRMCRTALKLQDRNCFQFRHSHVGVQFSWYGIAILLAADFWISTIWLYASSSLQRNSFRMCPKPLSTRHLRDN